MWLLSRLCWLRSRQLGCGLQDKLKLAGTTSRSWLWRVIEKRTHRGTSTTRIGKNTVWNSRVLSCRRGIASLRVTWMSGTLMGQNLQKLAMSVWESSFLGRTGGRVCRKKYSDFERAESRNGRSRCSGRPSSHRVANRWRSYSGSHRPPAL